MSDSKSINDSFTAGQPWTGGDVVTTFFSVVIGAFAIGQASPHLQAFASGRAAAYKIFSVPLYLPSLSLSPFYFPFFTPSRSYSHLGVLGH